MSQLRSPKLFVASNSRMFFSVSEDTGKCPPPKKRTEERQKIIKSAVY